MKRQHASRFNENRPSNPMPALTIDGKRQIIAFALEKMGEDPFTQHIQSRGIGSVRLLYEGVRRYKAKFFRELWDIANPT